MKCAFTAAHNALSASNHNKVFSVSVVFFDAAFATASGNLNQFHRPHHDEIYEGWLCCTLAWCHQDCKFFKTMFDSFAIFLSQYIIW